MAQEPQRGETAGSNYPTTMNDSYHTEIFGRGAFGPSGGGVHFITLKAFLNNIQQIAAKDMAADCKCQSCNDRRAIMKLAADAIILMATPTH
jgi:hypothetical protein